VRTPCRVDRSAIFSSRINFEKRMTAIHPAVEDARCRRSHDSHQKVSFSTG
jgi:hypothetical protein